MSATARDRMKNWEAIADNSQQGRLDVGLRLSHRCERANDLDCWRHIVATETGLVCVRMRSWLPLSNGGAWCWRAILLRHQN